MIISFWAGPLPGHIRYPVCLVQNKTVLAIATNKILQISYIASYLQEYHYNTNINILTTYLVCI